MAFKNEGRITRGATKGSWQANSPALNPTPAPTTTSTPKPKPSIKSETVPGAGTQSGTGNNANNAIKSKLDALGIKTSSSTDVNGALNLEALTPTQLSQIGKLLQKLGYAGITAQGQSVKTKLSTDSVLSTFVSKATNFSELYNSLVADYLPGLDTATSTTNYTTRNIYKYQPQDIYDIANGVYQSVLGRDATLQEKQQAYAKLLPAIQAGTVSKTQRVKNPKTGVVESVTTQTPGFSQKQAEADIKSNIKGTNFGEYNLKESLDFMGALNKVLAGGM